MLRNHWEKLYVIFADDFIVGSKDQKTAENLKMELTEWVRNEIGLELNEEKTLITNWTKDPISYLGYNIRSLEKELEIKPDIKRRIKAFKQKLIVTSESTQWNRNWTTLASERSLEEIEQLWSGCLIGNIYDKEDILIKKLIEPDWKNKFGGKGWIRRQKSEKLLKELGIDKLYPEMFITMNANKYKRNWIKENAYIVKRAKWSLKKRLKKALKSQWLALELKYNFAEEIFGGNWSILPKSVISKNPILKFTLPTPLKASSFPKGMRIESWETSLPAGSWEGEGRKSIIDLLRVNKTYLENKGKIINETIWIPMIGEEKLDENVSNWMKFNVDFREHYSNSNDMVLLISEINGQTFVGVRITAKIWGLISNWRNHNTESRVKKYLGGWVNKLD